MELNWEEMSSFSETGGAVLPQYQIRRTTVLSGRSGGVRIAHDAPTADIAWCRDTDEFAMVMVWASCVFGAMVVLVCCKTHVGILVPGTGIPTQLKQHGVAVVSAVVADE